MSSGNWASQKPGYSYQLLQPFLLQTGSEADKVESAQEKEKMGFSSMALPNLHNARARVCRKCVVTPKIQPFKYQKAKEWESQASGEPASA